MVERERALAYESLVISKIIMYRCWKLYFEMLLLRVGFARQSRIFDSIDALHAFYHIPKCLNWETFFPEFHSDLICSRTLTTFFLLFCKGASYLSLKVGHHWPASETPLNGFSLACRWWPNVECWLGSFENFRGSGPVLLRNSIFLWIFRGGGGGGVRPPAPPLDPRLGQDYVYTYWDILKTHFIVRISFCTTLCIACTNF